MRFGSAVWVSRLTGLPTSDGVRIYHLLFPVNDTSPACDFKINATCILPTRLGMVVSRLKGGDHPEPLRHPFVPCWSVDDCHRGYGG
jgi:hypothetical protein